MIDAPVDISPTHLEAPQPGHSETENQRQFLIGLQLIAEGRPEEAVDVLSDLYARSPTPRIRLELARALMLSGRLGEARQLFVEAYDDDPPAAVKSSILVFIDRIDRQRGRLKLQASIARFGNPLRQPDTYSFDFGGIELTFEPDDEYRDIWGITLGGQYDRQIADDTSVAVSASYRELRGDLADRFTGNVGVQHRLGPRVSATVGAARLDQKFQSFTLPFTRVAYTETLGPRAALQPALTVGYFFSDAGSSLSGVQVEASLPYLFTPTPTQRFAVGPIFQRREAGFAEQSFTSIGLRASAQWRFEEVSLELSLRGRLTRFDEIDPFWLERREEAGASVAAAISSERLRVGSFVPGLTISCDLVSSSIDYFEQRNCDYAVQINRIF
ncbi:tetratricopeptide repeat protein [Sphingomicrobium sediminis]|uniref:Tetratricopeptide repeat protein n=1 Tax=Sphingomicrobium sediminis TaxID=2950949 RepID=A0A9X2EIS5_9SPHN|nr:tetratricopeptide repeat protein [Sphingomicrobium sediminis]MCM8558275.1 tetratricopeptide repeat protein [Sphingomicrobium sediminis]